MAPKSTMVQNPYFKLAIRDASRHAFLIDYGIYRLLLFLIIFNVLQRSMQIPCTFLQEMLSMHDRGKKGINESLCCQIWGFVHYSCSCVLI